MAAEPETPAFDYAATRAPRGPAEAAPSWAWPCPRCHGVGWFRGDWADTGKGKERRLVKCPCGNAFRGPVEARDRDAPF